MKLEKNVSQFHETEKNSQKKNIYFFLVHKK